MSGEGTHGSGRAVPRSALLVISAVVAAVSVAWFAVRLWHPYGPPVVGWLPLPVSPLLAAFAADRVARRAGTPEPARRFWRCISVAAAAMVLGITSAAHDALSGPGAPAQRAGPVTSALFVVSTLLVVYALIRLPRLGRSSGEWLTVGLDIGIVLVGTGLVMRHLLASDVAQSDTTAGDALVWLSAVALAVVGVLAAVKISLPVSSGIDHRTMWILGGTVLAGALAGSSSNLLDDRPDLSILMPAIPPIYFGVVLAGELRLRRPVLLPGPAGDTGPGRARRLYNLLPYGAVACTDTLLLGMSRGLPAGAQLMIAGSVALTGMVIVRQLIAFHDNARLLSRVDASLLELRRHEQRFRSLVQNSDDIISIINAEGRYTYVSPSIRRVLGLDVSDWLGKPSTVGHMHPADLAAAQETFAKVLAQPGVAVHGQSRLRHADGTWRWMEFTCVNLLADPAVQGLVCNARDVTATRRYQDQLAYQATHDELTGLASRSLFTSRTDRAVVQGRPGTVAVALVDLDDFKTINDRLGHSVGDALLVAVAARLRGCVRPDDTVARLGGDEFAILLTGLLPGDTGAIADRIIKALSVPVSAAGHDLLVQASIGLAENDQQAYQNADDLLRRADVAMYAAKELGKNRYMHYNDDLDARAVEHAQLAAELSQALERDQLYVLYQPIVDLPTGQIQGVEALVRWDHPEQGTISPARFIPVAERTGLIVPLGEWVMRTACTQAVDWQRRYGPAAPWYISVNVSARQLMEPTFPQTVATVLAETGLAPAQLTVEITETAVFGGGRAVEAVVAIHALGVGVALDDFGTGHSSLGLLRTCPVDVLKVDKSFVDGVTGTVEQEAIARSIIEIAQALRLRAVAEGVEAPEQAERLHTLGYRLAQGFHFARPMRAADIPGLLHDRHNLPEVVVSRPG